MLISVECKMGLSERWATGIIVYSDDRGKRRSRLERKSGRSIETYCSENSHELVAASEQNSQFKSVMFRFNQTVLAAGTNQTSEFIHWCARKFAAVNVTKQLPRYLAECCPFLILLVTQVNRILLSVKARARLYVRFFVRAPGFLAMAAKWTGFRYSYTDKTVGTLRNKGAAICW